MTIRTTLLRLLLLSQLVVACFSQDWEDEFVDTDLTAVEIAEENALVGNAYHSIAHAVSTPGDRELAANGVCREIVRNGHGMAKKPLQSWKPMRCKIVGGQAGPNKYLRSIKSYSRGSVHSGPAQDLDMKNPTVQACFREGQHLIFSALMKLLRPNGTPYACSTSKWNVPQTCPLFSMRMFFNDGTPPKWFNSWNKGLTGDPWRAGRWNLYSTTFTVSADLAKAKQVYFMVRGPPAHQNILVSNVSIRPFIYPSASPTTSPTSSEPTRPIPTRKPTPVPTAYRITESPTIPPTIKPTYYTYKPPESLDKCDMEMYNGDFENGKSDPSPWSVNEGGILSIVSPGYKSDHALKHGGRTAKQMGPRHPINTDCFVTGKQIEFSAKIKLVFDGRRMLQGENETTSDDTGSNETLPEVVEGGSTGNNDTTTNTTDVGSNETLPEVAQGGSTGNNDTTASSDDSENAQGGSTSGNIDSFGSIDICDPYGPGNCSCPLLTIHTYYDFGEEHTYSPNDSTMKWRVDDYNTFHTVFTVTERMTLAEKAYFYFERPPPGYSIYMDDVTAQEFQPIPIGNILMEGDDQMSPTCDVIVANGDAELGDTSGWTARLGGHLSIRPEGADGTDYSFEHGARSSFIMGPRHQLKTKCFTQGMFYEFNAKIKLLDEEGKPFACEKTHTWIDDTSCPLLTFQLISADGEKTWSYFGNQDLRPWNAFTWNSFKAQFVITKEMAEATDAYFFIERPRAGVTIILDQVEISRDCSRLISSTDAEDDSLLGWTVMNGAGGYLGIHPEGANGSGHSYGHFGRITNGGGPGHKIDMGCLVSGTQYEFSLKMKLIDELDNNKFVACKKYLAWGDPDFCPLMSITMNQGSNDPFTKNYDSDNVLTWMADDWNYYHVIFTVDNYMAAMADGFLTLKGVRPGIAILFDNVQLNVYENSTLTSSCSSLVENGDFEDGVITGWDRFHSGTLQIYPEGADGSTKSLLMVDRELVGAGPEYNLDTSCLVEGKEYEFKAKLKLLTADRKPFSCVQGTGFKEPLTCPYVSIHSSKDGVPLVKHYMDEIPTVWDATAWNEYSFVFTISHDLAAASTAFIVFKGPAPEIGIVFDKVTLTPYNPPTADCTQLVTNTNAELGILIGWTVHTGGMIGLYDGEGANGSTNSFIFTERKDHQYGPLQFLPTECLLEGAQYDFYVHFKLLDQDGGPIACVKGAAWGSDDVCPLVTFDSQGSDGKKERTQAPNLYGAEWLADEFNEYHAIVTVTTAMAEADRVSFFFQGPPGGVNILFDNVSMKLKDVATGS